MSPGPPIVVVLSTGRCGTQWLTDTLAGLYPEIDVAHEPIGPLYRPRLHFRRWGDPEAILSVPDVDRHLRRVLARDRTYVETGWPLFAALPWLAAAVPDRLRVLHLHRHPVPTALSHASHSSYAGSARDDAYTRLATLGPQDPRVFQPHYAEVWEELSAYEKCLFWWTEVNLFALEFAARRPDIRRLELAAEDLLSGRAEPLRRLADLIGVPWREELCQRTRTVVDRWHHHTDAPLEPAKIRGHAVTVALSGALGYTVDSLDDEAFAARYSGTPDPGRDRLVRKW